MKQNRTWLITINTTLVLLFLLFLISIVLTLKDVYPLSIELTKSGLDNLITLFNTSIKIGAALLAIITIKVYFSNINQTDKIIARTDLQVASYIKSENLKNYFLHREEFKLFIQELDFIKDIIINQSYMFYSIWDNLYRTFYYSSYKYFEPKLSENAKCSILNYLNTIKESHVNVMSVHDFEINELNTLASLIMPPIEDLMKKIVDYHFAKYFKEIFSKESPTDQKETVYLLLKVLHTKQLYESILIFEGENMVSSDIFDNHVNEYFNKFKSN